MFANKKIIKKKDGKLKNKIADKIIIAAGNTKYKRGCVEKFFRYPYNKGSVIAKCGSANKNMTEKEKSCIPVKNRNPKIIKPK